MGEKRTPWLKWYPADWRADPKLRMCSLAARGVWIEMLGFMHEAEPYGHLVIAEAAPTDQQLAVLIGATPLTVKRAIVELEAHAVFSRSQDGVIYSRRMVRDKAQAERDRENGKGGGNPKLRAAVNPPDDRGVNPPDKAQMPEARSQMLEPKASLRSALGRASRLPPDFLMPDDWLTEARKTREKHGLPAVNLEVEALQFVNFWAAKSGKDATKLDWRKTWINWAMKARGASNANGFRGGGNIGGSPDWWDVSKPERPRSPAPVYPEPEVDR